ncbi:MULTISPECIES: hypothetical protein [unclassified Bradyrhizobium]|uniref:hypothetical protein n=1 Tax=Bradyrhizobium sp. USDA 4541 TaxID=2817704 RepID=UPI0020A3508A|nr:hypothetical protein [Bradyrhizobium sp. USDA 4541]MCP1848380.1 hypothetical protein [Bradyrhizobium sp. USDA 4541]
MARRTRKKPALVEHRLSAMVETSTFSYFIADRETSRTSTRVDDEAIVEVVARIVKIEPPQPERIGQALDCRFVTARSFVSEGERKAGEPLFLSVNLRRGQNSTLAYLPEDAFWALQSRFGRNEISHLEISYQAPVRGIAKLMSIYLSEVHGVET